MLVFPGTSKGPGDYGFARGSLVGRQEPGPAPGTEPRRSTQGRDREEQIWNRHAELYAL